MLRVARSRGMKSPYMFMLEAATSSTKTFGAFYQNQSIGASNVKLQISMPRRGFFWGSKKLEPQAPPHPEVVTFEDKVRAEEEAMMNQATIDEATQGMCFNM